jgi:succinoglycan biosynthesis transport protein ExoP
MDYSISRQLPPQEAQLLNSRGFSNNGGLPPIETSHPLTLRDVLAALKRRRKAALIFAGVVMGLVILYLCVATRRYAGDAILEFDKQNADMLALNGGTPAQQSDALDYNITLQTQVSILESDTLALRLFKELNLEETEDYKPKTTLLDLPGKFLALFQTQGPSEDGLPLDQAPQRRAKLLKKFHRLLKVEIVPGSRMIEVTFFNPDRYLAAEGANRLLSDYIDYSFQTRYLATTQATGWLGKQLEEIKAKMEADQARAAKLQQEAGVYGVGQDKHNTMLAHLEALDTSLAAAQANRIVKEVAYRAMQTGDPETVAGLANNVSMGGAPATTPINELTTIQALRSQEAISKARVFELNEKYGAKNPQVIEANQQLQSIQASIQAESGRLAARAKNDLEIATQTESSARRVFQEQKTQAEQLNDKTIQYEIAANEAASSQDLYQGLLKKLKEAGVMGSLQATNAYVVDPARVSGTPAQPRSLLLLAAGLAFSLIGAVCTAVAMEAIDGTITSVGQIGTITGLPTLGFVPRYDSLNGANPSRFGAPRARPLLAANGTVVGANGSTDSSRKRLIVERDVMVGECFRAIRTAVLLAAKQNRRSQVIAVSSPLPGEGKTTTALNLSLVLAQQGSRVLLVDADMRRPSIEKELKMGAASRQGLSSALMFGSSDGMVTHLPNHNNLYFLPSGTRPEHPADLLGSPAMLMLLEKWRKEYDFVVLDLPPILLVTDTAVLAPAMDGIVLVARHGITSRDALHRASAIVNDSGGNVLGVLLNAIDKTSDSYYGYYGHDSYFAVEATGSRS